MPSAELGSLDPIQEEIQTKVGQSELRCPGNSAQAAAAAAHRAPAAASGDEKHKTKYSAICVQGIIQSLPHAGARDDEAFSARRASKKAAVIARQILSVRDDCSCRRRSLCSLLHLLAF